MSIKFYKIKDPHGYMSNFYRSPIYIYNRWWRNVEAAYQSRKFSDEETIDKLAKATSAKEAREIGQGGVMRSDWDQVRYEVMKECVLAKFLQNQPLKEHLLNTGDEYLIEDSPVDSYWGCGADGNGQNQLGRILVEAREIIKQRELLP